MKNKPYPGAAVVAFVRAVFVGAASVLICMLTGTLLSEILNTFWQYSQSGFWFNTFHLLSQYRGLIGLFICLAGIALFAGWIFAPVFNDLSRRVSGALRLDDEEGEAVHFPRSLRPLENDLKDINKELKLYKYAMREAEQRKDDLVVYLAHDIRTPLTSVLGYLELLEESPGLPAQQREKYIGIALRKARRMQALVEELFEITRFNVGRIELERSQANAGILFHQLAEEMMPLLESRGVGLEMDNRGVDTLFVDPAKMARAVDNVLQNAARFADPGTAVKVLLEPLEGGRTRIAVSNKGADIPKEKLERFFEKFYRADEARQSSGGTGLGLAITKSIVEAHGGTITAENHEGTTTFTIIL